MWCGLCVRARVSTVFTHANSAADTIPWALFKYTRFTTYTNTNAQPNPAQHSTHTHPAHWQSTSIKEEAPVTDSCFLAHPKLAHPSLLFYHAYTSRFLLSNRLVWWPVSFFFHQFSLLYSKQCRMVYCRYHHSTATTECRRHFTSTLLCYHHFHFHPCQSNKWKPYHILRCRCVCCYHHRYNLQLHAQTEIHTDTHTHNGFGSFVTNKSTEQFAPEIISLMSPRTQ